jgi:hypothetical protein
MSSAHPTRAADDTLQDFSLFSGSLIGTCRDALTTRVLPSCGLWLRSVSRTRKNFSESIIASHVCLSLKICLRRPSSNSITCLRCCAAAVQAASSPFLIATKLE